MMWLSELEVLPFEANRMNLMVDPGSISSASPAALNEVSTGPYTVAQLKPSDEISICTS